MSTTTYDIGSVGNDLLNLWRQQGYKLEAGTTLVKGATTAKPLDRKMVRVARNGAERTRISLKKVFGEVLETATHIRYGGLSIPITRADKAVETTRLGLTAGTQIAITAEQITQERHEIPITNISFETYVAGEYAGRQSRKILIKGKKYVRIGIEAPQNVDEEEFWQTVYNQLRKAIIEHEDTNNPGGEWFERLLNLREFGGSYVGEEATIDLSYDTWNWHLAETKGDFPKNSTQLRSEVT